MNEEAISAVLLDIRDVGGRALLARADIGQIAFEDDWIGVVVNLDEARPDSIALVHAGLRRAFPHAAVEVRCGMKVFRGGAGFGEGKHVIAVLGGKGGVGKSTLALNLALTFAAMGLRTGLLDGDLGGPDIPHMLGIHVQRTPRDLGWKVMTASLRMPSKRERPLRRYEVECMSAGFVLPERTWPRVMGHDFVSLVLRYLLFEVDWQCDILIIDAPPGTGSELQVMAKELPLSGALFVTTPQDLAQVDAGRTLTLLQENQVPVIGLVQNMAAMTCPHCGQEIDMFSSSRRLEDEGVEVLGRIPFDTRLALTADQGLPLVLGDPTGPIAYQFAMIGAKVRRWITDGTPSAETN
jgi:ATP-binding protein involved in chromosome partitioning